MGWTERKCKLCGKSILLIDRIGADPFPVDWPPADVTVIRDRRKQAGCSPFVLPCGDIVQARKPVKSELSLTAYVPHQLTCPVFNKKE